MTKDVMIREVTDRATDIFNIDVDENHPKKKFTQKEITSVLRAFAEAMMCLIFAFGSAPVTTIDNSIGLRSTLISPYPDFLLM